MRYMRGLKLSTKITAFLVFSLAISSLLMTVSPRPASAEGPLLHSVRCLVRTVLLTNCKTAPAAEQQAPATAPVQNSSQPPAQTAPAQTQPSVPQQSSTPPEGELTVPEPVALPTGEVLAPTGVVTTNANLGTGHGIQQSEYVAYFNKFSPYAIVGAQQAAEAKVPLRQSAEGWKIFGTAWYWWGVVLLAVILILPPVRRGILSKLSALSKNQ